MPGSGDSEDFRHTIAFVDGQLFNLSSNISCRGQHIMKHNVSSRSEKMYFFENIFNDMDPKNDHCL